MNTLTPGVTTWLLAIILSACATLPTPSDRPKPADTFSPVQVIEPSQVQIPVSLAFAAPLVEALNQSGLTILSVQSSVSSAYFQSTNEAVWIETNQGILEAVFLADTAEAEQIRITEKSGPQETGRFTYIIQAPAPTLQQDLTIEAAFRLYFTIAQNMLLQTSSPELDQTLKLIF